MLTASTMLNETHDPELRSWVESANVPAADFPVQNLPFSVFRRAGSTEVFRGGVAIGDQILDLLAALKTDVWESGMSNILEAAARSTLNQLMARGPQDWSALRLALSRALRTGSALKSALQPCLVPQSQAQYALPACIGDYTDFYISVHHALAVGRLFRPDNPLLPNYKWLPIGYHGRSSSIIVSGECFPRPTGQILDGGSIPKLAASRRLDYELELGVFIGRGNVLGSRIDIKEAESHIFGLCLLNDWSARDIQAWEYQPLGPFLGKNFATTISPWIVTLEALAPFRTAWRRPAADPQPLQYLDSPNLRTTGAIDIQLEVHLESEAMRRAGFPACRLSRTSFEHAYWTIAQMVAHHTVNGCNLQPGDLLGTGTQSGPEPHEGGSLIELSHGGKQPLTLPNGETRRFLEDGDTIIMRGYCEHPGAARVGFGDLTGRVLPVVGERGSQIDAG
jgi:fumarylacetoacetase